MTNVVENYGWASSNNPYSFDCITPKILDVLKKLNTGRVCDLGSGNGALASALHQAGFYVAGVEYDGKGIDLSKSNYPVHFYNLGVQNNPEVILDQAG